MQNGLTNRSREILTRSPDFVPTAFDPSGDVAEVDWQTAMSRAIRCGSELRRALGLPQQNADLEAEKKFPTFVPLEYLRRIQPGDPSDPLLLQVMPSPDEDSDQAGFSSDPVGDLDAMVAEGAMQKYAGRALLVTTGACGVHCRYCFRREFPYSEFGSRTQRWRPSIEYLRSNSELEEVLLSGGDPLTVVDSALSELIGAIETIGHVRRLRIHSRMPIVIPQRVTDELVRRLAASRLTVWFVVHANHPAELDAHVLSRLAKLIDAGIPVLNQAVLLRGINDNEEALIGLCRKLVDHRITPYYLHQLDQVRGAAHFAVPVDRGHDLIQRVRESLPGYAVPTYVVEQAGEASKSPLNPNR